jgi:3-hydroxyisobutyrate dehydrogenase-like beta-hydroxyacid dehydrogenase
VEETFLKASSSDPATTLGILYCGDMGSAFGKLLREGGLRVVTTCEGRGRVTERQALAAGIEILPRLEDVVAQSHFVFSLVLPTAAIEVAEQYVKCRRMRPAGSVFVEANSIGLKTLEQIERLMAEHDVPLVDAAFHGVAHRLKDLGVLHVSGPEARRVEEICQGLLTVNWLGTRIGSASVLKLLMSAIAKGLAGLFLEVGSLAERADMLESFLQSCQHFYPPVMAVIERILPTYPRHALRRVNEMRDIEELGRAFELRLGMTHEAGKLIQLIASLPWDQMEAGTPVDMRTIIRSVAKARPSENPCDAFSEV